MSFRTQAMEEEGLMKKEDDLELDGGAAAQGPPGTHDEGPVEEADYRDEEI